MLILSKNNRHYEYCLYSAAWLLLAYFYVDYITVIFAYEGYFHSASTVRMIIGYLSVMLLVYLTPPSSDTTFSYYFYHLNLVLVILPMSILYSFSEKSTIFYAQSCFAYLVIVFLPKFFPVRAIRFASLSQRLLANIFLLIAVALVLALAWLNGFSTFNLDMRLVYEFRDSTAESLPSAFGYIIPFVTKVAAPLCFILFVMQGRRFLALVSLAVAALLFGFTSHKSVVLYPFVLISLYMILISKRPLFFLLLAMISFILLSGAFLFLSSVFDSDLLLMAGSMFLRRGLFVPADLNYAYYEFFSVNNLVYWANSKLTLGVFDYPYTMTLSHVIGDFRFEGTDTGANTGWLGSGYAHAGYLGVLVYAIIIAFFLKYADILVRITSTKALSVSAMLIPALALITSSDLPTALLTHGFLGSIIVASMLRRV